MDLRAQQGSFIQAALGDSQKDSSRALPSCLFLWGPSNSGKSYILDNSLATSGIENRVVVRIDSVEIICGWKPFLQSILRQLLEQTDRLDTTQKKLGQVDGLNSFVAQIRLIGREALDQHSLILVVDHVDILRKKSPDVLKLVMRLREYTETNICTVLLSHLPWRSYFHITDCPIPLQLHFPQYTKSEIVQIISSKPPPNSNVYAYEFHVEMVVDVYHKSYRDLKILWKLVEKRQGDFLQHFNPIEEPTQNELNRIWCKSVKGLLKNESLQFKNKNTKFVENKEDDATNMPITLIFFLLAAFIASQNPASTDRQIFGKQKSKTKPRRGEAPIKYSKSGVSQSRIIAIFGKLSQSRFWPDTVLQSSIEDLITTGFLSRFGSDKVDDPKYRIHVTTEFAQKLSDAVGVKLDEVLVSRF